jgi:hypothetical protein
MMTASGRNATANDDRDGQHAGGSIVDTTRADTSMRIGIIGAGNVGMTVTSRNSTTAAPAAASLSSST